MKVGVLPFAMFIGGRASLNGERPALEEMLPHIRWHLGLYADRGDGLFGATYRPAAASGFYDVHFTYSSWKTQIFRS